MTVIQDNWRNNPTIMKIVVVDNSVIVSLFGLDGQRSDNAVKMRSYMDNKNIQLITPCLLYIEFGNVLISKSKKDKSVLESSEHLLQLLYNSNIKSFNTNFYLPEIFTIASKYQLSFYDATYLFLTIHKKAELLTDDKKLHLAYECYLETALEI